MKKELLRSKLNRMQSSLYNLTEKVNEIIRRIDTEGIDK